MQRQFASRRLSRAGPGFGAVLIVGSGVRVTSEVAALFAVLSARAGTTFISFNRARTSGVKPGKDATGRVGWCSRRDALCGGNPTGVGQTERQRVAGNQD